jgi:phosphoribosylglycinamide formyltransferase-1
MKRIVILTGSNLRHAFVRKYLGGVAEIEVVRSYCEGRENDLRAVVESGAVDGDLRLKHLAARDRAEADFFGLFVDTVADRSNPVYLPKGAINSPAYCDDIGALEPDLLIAYGCSIIREPLLGAYRGRFLNVHLGLSPYYRGGGTNYWPLVNGEPEYVGATFMHLDAGIDTGEIIHQIRAEYAWGDTPSQIGNRLILSMCPVYRDLIIHFDRLKRMPQPPPPDRPKVYRKRDYTEESVVTLYRNFADGLIETYLRDEKARGARVPLVVNPALERSR